MACAGAGGASSYSCTDRALVAAARAAAKEWSDERVGPDAVWERKEGVSKPVSTGHQFQFPRANDVLRTIRCSLPPDQEWTLVANGVVTVLKGRGPIVFEPTLPAPGWPGHELWLTWTLEAAVPFTCTYERTALELGMLGVAAGGDWRDAPLMKMRMGDKTVRMWRAVAVVV